MFDFHMHSTVSYDGENTPAQMVKVAEQRGLKVMCFTDHLDYSPVYPDRYLIFDEESYWKGYNGIESNRVQILHGMEFGMLPDNASQLAEDLKMYPFDYVLGSCHFVDGLDLYFPEYWEGKSQEQAERLYFEELLECVRAHDHFDVCSHLTYISKAGCNPIKRPIVYGMYKDLVDEILKTLAKKEKGLEINTSGLVASCGVFLPDEPFLQRFKELGGRIVTVGSDAHTANRVGENCDAACYLAAKVFGYVCTFEDRKPIFHKI